MPLTPVTQTNPPSGIRTSTFFRLFSRAAFEFEAVLSGSNGRRTRRRDDRIFAGEIFNRRAVRLAQNTSGIGPAHDHIPAMRPGAGADVDQIIGRPDAVFIMLDHDDGVADVFAAV